MTIGILISKFVDEEKSYIEKSLFNQETADIVLQEIEVEDNEVYIHASYKRKYFQKQVKLKTGIAGWNVENKSDRGVPFNISLVFSEGTYDFPICIDAVFHYQGNAAKVRFVVSREGDVDYSELDSEESYDCIGNRKFNCNVDYNDVEGMFIRSAIGEIAEDFRVCLAHLVEDDIEDYYD